MTIEVTAYAPSRTVGLAFMQACGIAEEKDGVIRLYDPSLIATRANVWA